MTQAMLHACADQLLKHQFFHSALLLKERERILYSAHVYQTTSVLNYPEAGNLATVPPYFTEQINTSATLGMFSTINHPSLLCFAVIFDIFMVVNRP